MPTMGTMPETPIDFPTLRLIGWPYAGLPDDAAWADLFAAYAINKTVSVTAAYVDLGDIATFRNQRGLYISLQAGF